MYQENDDSKHNLLSEKASETQTTSDHWQIQDANLRMICDRLAIAADGLSYELGKNGDYLAVNSYLLQGCDVYSVLMTDVHTDEDFPRWTALLVLKTNNHLVNIDNCSRTIIPRVGDIIWFDLHLPHDLDLPPEDWPKDKRQAFRDKHLKMLCRDYLFVCAHIDVNERLTRHEVEGMFLNKFKLAFEHNT